MKATRRPLISSVSMTRPLIMTGASRLSTLAGRKPELNYARARILGGCANHNDCAFLRPPHSDFAEWEKRGAEGWGPADMAPYFHRVIENTNVEEAPHHPASQIFVQAGIELGLKKIDFQKQISAGRGLLSTECCRAPAPILFHHLSPSPFTIAETPGSVDGNPGHKNSC